MTVVEQPEKAINAIAERAARQAIIISLIFFIIFTPLIIRLVII